MKSEKNAYTAPVRNRISVTGSKKFLDKVFGGNCGEVVAQYSSHNGIDPKNTYSVIVEVEDGLFLFFSKGFISSLQSNYNLTLHAYEHAKERAGFFEKIEANLLKSRIKNLADRSFDDKDRKILKIALESDSAEQYIKNIEAYNDFLIESGRAFSSDEFKISYDFFELDKFVREKARSSYSYIEVAEKFADNVTSFVSSVSILDLTFSYNKTFCSQIRNFVTAYALNCNECLEILDSVQK